ncbi:MAG: LuxR family transcriptional regulator [Nitrospiraceae bacterium]|nr:LuxR family transcriptional regulator [Nitrospiraceae bacterium]
MVKTEDGNALSLNLLGKAEIILLMELVQESLTCETLEQFSAIINKLGNLICFDHCISGFAAMENGGLKTYDIVYSSYPDGWLKVYEGSGYHNIDPIVRENFTRFGLQYWKDTYREHTPPKKFLMESGDFNLKEGYTAGTRNRKGSEGSIFSISGSFLKREKRVEIALGIIAPHLHNSMLRICNETKRQKAKISVREKDVLSWLKEGKSSWDISGILNVSEATVNFHIKNIMQKLDTVNRAQSVAKAIEIGVIDI